jgi:hypothetical protein
MVTVARLFLDQNLLTGTVPDSFANLGGLEELNLSYNDLEGSIDEDVCLLESLDIFIADCSEVQCPCCTECTTGS